jgi:ketosteroid isomerase-like protein
MSEGNVEIVQNAIAAFDRGDVEEVLRLCDEDILIKQASELPASLPSIVGTPGSWKPSRSGRSSGMTIGSRL